MCRYKGIEMVTNTRKKWDPFALSPLDQVKIKHAFSNMAAGDVIDGREKEEAFRLVVIRKIKNKGVVIAQSCNSGKSLIQVFDAIFAWSDKEIAIVDQDGRIPPWWNADLQMTRDECVEFAKKYSHIPVSADIPAPSTEELQAMKDFPSSRIARAVEILNYGGGLASIVLSAKELGVSLTPVEAVAIYLMYQRLYEVKRADNPPEVTINIEVPLPGFLFQEQNIPKGETPTKH